MQLQARLVHAEPGSRVVEVSAMAGDTPLGSALGEAPNAEEAEERALARLQQRLQGSTAAPSKPEPSPRPAQNPTASYPATSKPSQQASPEPQLQLPELPLREPAAEPVAEPPPDPDDWSSELAQLDLELRRLGWQREQEALYLERAFGHPSRSRLTSYGDLVAYLQALQGLTPGSDPALAPVPLRRRDLLSQCDQLLDQLQWNASQGRQCLEQHFQLSSRQQLSDSQLLQFNMLLEEQLIKATG